MFTEDYNNMSNIHSLDSAIKNAQDKLLSLQHKDGYWLFELEADCTIPAEYINPGVA
jgi:squalene-hopene/tetraprenyl-beta-curcumene cyclase